MSDQDKRVVSLVSNQKPDDIAASVGEMRDRLPAMIEYQKVIVKLQRATYLAAIAEGFTPQEALELAKHARP